MGSCVHTCMCKCMYVCVRVKASGHCQVGFLNRSPPYFSIQDFLLNLELTDSARLAASPRITTVYRNAWLFYMGSEGPAQVLMLARCPGFDSVVIKYSDEKKLSEERSLSLSVREGHSARSLRQTVIAQPQSRAANDSLLACVCSAQFLLTYTV